MELLTPEEGALAVRLARATLEKQIAGKSGEISSVPPVFSEKRGVFVTLTRKGELRGCIGFPYPTFALGKAIAEAAIAAALEDPRFPPVRASELPDLKVEVTVLSIPENLGAEPAERPQAIEVGRHGLIVKGYGRSGLLLPQVPVEWKWDSCEFLDHTCRKAGLPGGCWKEKDVEVFTFEGQIFREE